MGQLPYGEDEVKTEGLDSQVIGYSLREAIHARQFWMLCAVFLCFGFCMQIIMVHIVPHAIDIGISLASAASIFTIIGGGSIIGRIIMGGSSDRIGNKLAIVIGFALMTIGLSLVVVAREIWMLYLFAAIFGFSYGGLVAVQSPLVADLFGLLAHGVIWGVIVFSVTIGGAIGPLLAGYIFDITSSYHLTFLVCVALSVAGLILILLLRKSPRILSVWTGN